MSYQLTPHLDAIFGQPADWRVDSARTEPPAPPARWFALLDVGPFVPVAKPLERLLARHPGELLFEPSAGAEALLYSPRLIELGPSLDAAGEQAESLDARCGHLPALSLLSGDLTVRALVERLRYLMWVDADCTPFLLRIADTPSMAAVAAMLTPAQRAGLFAGLQGWWCADHAGRLQNLVAAQEATDAQASAAGTHDADANGSGTNRAMRPMAPLATRFTLDAAQTAGVMRGTAGPMLAAQIRTAEPSFAQRLSHAEQATFASDLLEEARLEAYEEAELLGIARARWRAMQDHGRNDDV